MTMENKGGRVLGYLTSEDTGNLIGAVILEVYLLLLLCPAFCFPSNI